VHDVCWTYAKETRAVYFEVFTFDTYMLKFYAFFNDLVINKKINIFLEVRSLCK